MQMKKMKLLWTIVHLNIILTPNPAIVYNLSLPLLQSVIKKAALPYSQFSMQIECPNRYFIWIKLFSLYTLRIS